MTGIKEAENKMDERVKLILRELNEDDSVLNLGCADLATGGVWVHALVCEKVKSASGIDILSSEIEKYQDAGYDVKVDDAETIQLDEKFDVVLAGELIEHLSNPGKFLDRAREHLRSDGRMILTTPNAWCYHRFVSAAILGKVPVHDEHACWYDKATLVQLLGRHGFKIDKIEFVRIPPKRKTTLLGNLLYFMGLKQVGSETIFIKCSLNGKD
ncbi:MAG: class I SAM-dependent methyltransferase [Halobacteriota archaeon]|nr:class I SAM-dependent methyltransferase [Halobacteriota archaeon]